METKLIVPKFATEAEEADWWYANRDLVSDEFVRASEDGRLGRGTAMRRAMEANTVLLDAADVTKAHAVAKRKGVSYQTYVKSLVHDALEKESAA